MHKFADLIEKYADELASIDSLDNGKPFSHCRGFDLNQAVQTFRYYAGWCDKIAGQTISIVFPHNYLIILFYFLKTVFNLLMLLNFKIVYIIIILKPGPYFCYTRKEVFCFF